MCDNIYNLILIIKNIVFVLVNSLKFKENSLYIIYMYIYIHQILVIYVMLQWRF